jgi:hypothetical protein
MLKEFNIKLKVKMDLIEIHVSEDNEAKNLIQKAQELVQQKEALHWR